MEKTIEEIIKGVEKNYFSLVRNFDADMAHDYFEDQADYDYCEHYLSDILKQLEYIGAASRSEKYFVVNGLEYRPVNTGYKYDPERNVSYFIPNAEQYAYCNMLYNRICDAFGLDKEYPEEYYAFETGSKVSPSLAEIERNLESISLQLEDYIKQQDFQEMGER